MSVVALPSGHAQGEITEECIAERRLWLAVVTHAIEDWRGGTLRARREAQNFLFDSKEDFDIACSNAGLDSGSLRTNLLRIGRKIEMQGPWHHPLAA